MFINQFILKFRVLAICYIALGITNFYSQDHYFENYQVDDGLSHNTITSIIQDHQGFIWFGTKDGLNRFDGYSFKVFQHDPKVKKSLGSNFVRSLHEFKNNIWVGTDNGLFQYDEQKENFFLLTPTENEPILDINHDREGNLWFIAAGKLFRYAMNQKAAVTMPLPDGQEAQWISSNGSDMIIATNTGLYSYKTAKESFKRLPITWEFKDEMPFLITKIKTFKNHDL
ncbi:MAG: two-component regulator propeller domain-containing protein, partial [Leeuwenhoekiella sp.]